MIKQFRQLNRENNLTVIIVTHDQNVARNADRTIVLHDGAVVADTTDFQVSIESLQALEEA